MPDGFHSKPCLHTDSALHFPAVVKSQYDDLKKLRLINLRGNNFKTLLLSPTMFFASSDFSWSENIDVLRASPGGSCWQKVVSPGRTNLGLAPRHRLQRVFACPRTEST